MQIWATLRDSAQVLIAQYDPVMDDQRVISYDLPGALEEVVAVRFLNSRRARSGPAGMRSRCSRPRLKHRQHAW